MQSGSWSVVLALCTVVVSSLCLLTNGDHINRLSFRQPFDEVDTYGNRVIGNNWVAGSNAVVKKGFIRLTPDRPDKRGYAWNSGQLDRDEWSLIFRFRISGSGKRWYGDGIGLWITQNAYFIPGDLHGFTPRFVGMGIVLDTYVNTENPGGHKDVALLVNNNEKSLEELYEATQVGCSASIRYQEAAATFSTLNHSRVRLSYKSNKLRIDIDPYASGKWDFCYEQEDLGLPEGWSKTASIGITAATGSLSDNHDALSLDVFTDAADSAHEVHDQYISSLTVPFDSNSFDDKFTGNLLELMNKLTRFQEDMEHEIETMKEANRAAFDKLHDQEYKLQERTKELEAKLKIKAEESVAIRVSGVATDIEDKLQDAKKQASQGGGWKWAFAFFLISVAGIAYFINKKFQRLYKSRIL